MNIGSSIKKFRSMRRLTQRKLAEKVGITVSYLSQIENDKREPSNSLLRELCGALEIPNEVLFWDAVVPPEGISRKERKVLNAAKAILQGYVEQFGHENEPNHRSQT